MKNIPSFTPGRIKRGLGPKGKLTERNYRKKALTHLLEDFEHRCAYSMRHSLFSGDDSGMQIDHFNPKLSGSARHHYRNLFLATAQCNNQKSDNWPTAAERRKGIRLLNPCEEQDYGVHIFENPQTYELVGMTPAGRYHIDCLDLNAPTFVHERKRRAEFRKKARDSNIISIPGEWRELLDYLQSLEVILDSLIPDIAPPPAD